MTNRSSSHQHGLSTGNQTRPKSKLRKRRNKALARARREARMALLTGKQPQTEATKSPVAKKPTQKKPFAKPEKTEKETVKKAPLKKTVTKAKEAPQKPEKTEEKNENNSAQQEIPLS